MSALKILPGLFAVQLFDHSTTDVPGHGTKGQSFVGKLLEFWKFSSVQLSPYLHVKPEPVARGSQDLVVISLRS